MKKVAILTLTFPGNDNAGAYIQAWALKRAIELYANSEASVVPLDSLPASYKPYKNKLRAILSCLNRKRKDFCLRLKKRIRLKKFREWLFTHASNERDWIPATLIVQHLSAYNTVVIGSDWVWYLPDILLDENPKNLNHLQQIFLGYHPEDLNARGIRRISYAASQGVMPTVASSTLKKAIKNFDAVSVREHESVHYFKEVLLVDSKITNAVDPTLLLDEEEYLLVEEEIKKPGKSQGGYIAVYFCRLLIRP